MFNVDIDEMMTYGFLATELLVIIAWVILG